MCYKCSKIHLLYLKSIVFLVPNTEMFDESESVNKDALKWKGKQKGWAISVAFEVMVILPLHIDYSRSSNWENCVILRRQSDLLLANPALCGGCFFPAQHPRRKQTELVVTQNVGDIGFHCEPWFKYTCSSHEVHIFIESHIFFGVYLICFVKVKENS